MNAARDGHAAVVRLLVDRGAQVNHTAKYGLTALMLAVIRSHVDVVRVLVDAGADLQVKGTGAPGFHGKTALDLAEGLGSELSAACGWKRLAGRRGGARLCKRPRVRRR